MSIENNFALARNAVPGRSSDSIRFNGNTLIVDFQTKVDDYNSGCSFEDLLVFLKEYANNTDDPSIKRSTCVGLADTVSHLGYAASHMTDYRIKGD